MTIVDTALFQLSLNLIALRIPARKCSAFMSRLQGHVLNRPRVRPILRDDASAESRLLLLAEGVTDVELAGLPAELAAYARAEGAEPVPHTVELDYSYFTADQVLRRLLPEGMEVPGAFEQVGHIAHVNLRDEHLPFKAVIGRVLLDKNAPRIRSVVNKVETISEQGGDDAATTARRVFRVFPMEVLAGDDDLRATVRENGASFKLDYREVYWNSRLEREHRRIVEMLQPGDVVADMFAGIGPFAVPAAMRGAKVYANDLNPQSAAWLRTNVDGNKVASRVAVSNLDGRAFVRHLLGTADGAAADGAAADGAAGAPTSPLVYGPFSRVLMNLPASAELFLDVFRGAFDRATWGAAPLPRVHCYCFSKAADPVADVLARAEAVVGCSLPGAEAIVVRDVAPSKLMMCVSFVVPDEIAWRDGAEEGAADEGVKRPRLD